MLGDAGTSRSASFTRLLLNDRLKFESFFNRCSRSLFLGCCRLYCCHPVLNQTSTFCVFIVAAGMCCFVLFTRNILASKRNLGPFVRSVFAEDYPLDYGHVVLIHKSAKLWIFCPALFGGSIRIFFPDSFSKVFSAFFAVIHAQIESLLDIMILRICGSHFIFFQQTLL